MARSKASLERSVKNERRKRQETEEMLDRFLAGVARKVGVAATPAATAAVVAKTGDGADYWDVRGLAVPKASLPMAISYLAAIGFGMAGMGKTMGFFEGAGDGHTGAISYMGGSRVARENSASVSLEEPEESAGSLGAGVPEDQVEELVREAYARGAQDAAAEAMPAVAE